MVSYMDKGVGVMEEKKSYKSWTLSDEFWEKVKGYIPKNPGRDPAKKYKHKPGQERKRLDPRKVLEGIFYILRSGCQWKAVRKNTVPEAVFTAIFSNGVKRDFSKISGR